MKDMDEILIWKYLDGLCDPAEKEEVEKRLLNDEKFKLALEQRSTLHKGLEGMEPEQPSMRFTLNVMENLPEMYNKLSVIPPLIQPVWRGIIVVTLALLFLTLPNLVVPSEEGTAGGVESLIQADQVNGLIQSIPFTYFVIAASLGLGFITLYFLDKRLKTKLKSIEN